MNAKAKKWIKYLEKAKIDCFNVQELKEGPHAAIHPVLFHVFMPTQTTQLPAMLVTDDTPFVMFQVLVLPQAADANNRSAILDEINRVNEECKVLKYYLNAEGTICLDSCIPCQDDSFDPTVIHGVLDVIMDHLKEQYPVWLDLAVQQKQPEAEDTQVHGFKPELV